MKEIKLDLMQTGTRYLIYGFLDAHQEQGIEPEAALAKFVDRHSIPISDQDREALLLDYRKIKAKGFS